MKGSSRQRILNVGSLTQQRAFLLGRSAPRSLNILGSLEESISLGHLGRLGGSVKETEEWFLGGLFWNGWVKSLSALHDNILTGKPVLRKLKC